MDGESRAARIARAIKEVADLDVVVEEDEGVILLEGLVDSAEDRQAAEDIATDLADGMPIDNDLEIEGVLPVSVDAFQSEAPSAELAESVEGLSDTEGIDPTDRTIRP
jgi:hypothetical protein